MDDDQKIAELTEAVRLDPNNAASVSALAKAKAVAQKAAEQKEAVRLNPNDVAAYIKRGYECFAKQDYDQAIEEFNKALRLDPNNARVYYSRGVVYANKRDYDWAIADLTKSVRLDPNNATSLEALAKVKAVAQKAAEKKETVLMSKIVLRVVLIACLVVMGCFFSGYFVVSCQGAEINISGMEAAFGIDKDYIPLDPAPLLLLIPGVALVVLIALSVPSVLEKLEGANLSAKLPVTGGAIGLLLLAIAHYAAIGKVKEELGGIDISSVYHIGLGFKTSVLAYTVMLVMPFMRRFRL
jgi:tetratricopeptide (TPR) repeat protein